MKTFTHVQALSEATLSVGQRVNTKGFHTDNDGGGAEYIIKATAPANGASIIALANNVNVAELLPLETANAKQFGIRDSTDATTALTEAVNRVSSLSFEGLTAVTWSGAIVVPPTCTTWLLHGANLKVTGGNIEFQASSMRIDMGGGSIKGGNKLGKVAGESVINGNTLVLEDASEFVVGDHIACSLDNGYLPNSPSRSGYLEHGDYNRITNITGNTLTMSYNFLRSDLYTVKTGIIAGAWVGTNKFGTGGLEFTGKGNVKIENGTIGRFPSYTIKVEDGTPDGQAVDPRTSTMHIQNVLFEDFTLDLIWFRGLGITFDNVKLTQQKDFGKQFIICSTPYDDGYIKFINGCNIARMNRDGEVLPFHFGDQAETECGLLYMDGTNIFDGAHDPDIAAAPDGQVQYYGANVPHSDSILAFHSFDSTVGIRWKGMHSNGDRFLNYMWGLFSTPSTPPPYFDFETIVFKGSYSECDPVFIKNPNTTQYRIKNNVAHFIGGEYHTRVNFQINQGVVTQSDGAKWVCPYDTTQIAATPTVELKDFHMVGGSLEGGWRVKSNTCSFREVVLAYANSYLAEPPKSLLLSAPLSTDGDVINFILEEPDLYENTALPLDDYDGILDLTRWVGFNQSTLGLGANIRFKMYGHSSEFHTGSELGFSKLYSVVYNRPTENAGLFAQTGLWSRPRLGDYIRTISAANSLEKRRIDQVLSTTVSVANTTGNTVVTLTDAPVGDEEQIGIYKASLNAWYWYNIITTAGSTVTVGNSASATTGIIQDIAVGDKVQLVKVEEAASGGSGTAFPDGSQYKLSNTTSIPADTNYALSFNENIYNELGAITTHVERLVVPVGVERVNIAGLVRYSNLTFPNGTTCTLDITQYNSDTSFKATSAHVNVQSGFTSHRMSAVGLGIPVVEGDYFELQVKNGSHVGSLTQAVFTMIQAK